MAIRRCGAVIAAAACMCALSWVQRSLLHAHGTMACSMFAFMHASAAGVTATARCYGMADVGRNPRESAPELSGLTALRLVEGSLALEGLRFEAPEQCWSSGGWLIVEFCSPWCLEAASGSMRVGPGGRSVRGESRCSIRTLYFDEVHRLAPSLRDLAKV
jgi:hypothetical protein